ncbi:MAG TPA: hypothetical protein VM469_00695, partial [Pseudoxanthomonas sp.]|nr:hypothetical protein [Pseudoxanthomonas sp.]
FAFSQIAGYCAAAVFAKVTVNRGLDAVDPSIRYIVCTSLPPCNQPPRGVTTTQSSKEQVDG